MEKKYEETTISLGSNNIKNITIASDIALAISRGNFNNDNFVSLDKYLSNETPDDIIKVIFNGVDAGINAIIDDIKSSKQIVVLALICLEPDKCIDDKEVADFLYEINIMCTIIIDRLDGLSEKHTNDIFSDIYTTIAELSDSISSSMMMKYQQIILSRLHYELCIYILGFFNNGIILEDK